MIWRNGFKSHALWSNFHLLLSIKETYFIKVSVFLNFLPPKKQKPNLSTSSHLIKNNLKDHGSKQEGIVKVLCCFMSVHALVNLRNLTHTELKSRWSRLSYVHKKMPWFLVSFSVVSSCMFFIFPDVFQGSHFWWIYSLHHSYRFGKVLDNFRL